MPGDDQQLGMRVLAIRQGVVHLQTGGNSPVSMRWRPGEAPVAAPRPVRAVDPLSGIALAASDDASGLLVLDPAGGILRRLATGPVAVLGPGGRFLYEPRHQPPGIAVYDLANQRPAARLVWLPTAAQVTVPAAPVWESPTRLLIRLRHDAGLGTPLLRLDLTTGGFERVPLPNTAGHHILPITPHKTPN